MGRLGFEPRTYRLKAEYSTVELATRRLIYLIKQFTNVTQISPTAKTKLKNYTQRFLL